MQKSPDQLRASEHWWSHELRLRVVDFDEAYRLASKMGDEPLLAQPSDVSQRRQARRAKKEAVANREHSHCKTVKRLQRNSGIVLCRCAAEIARTVCSESWPLRRSWQLSRSPPCTRVPKSVTACMGRSGLYAMQQESRQTRKALDTCRAACAFLDTWCL